MMPPGIDHVYEQYRLKGGAGQKMASWIERRSQEAIFFKTVLQRPRGSGLSSGWCQ